jgi:hypothetical protein
LINAVAEVQHQDCTKTLAGTSRICPPPLSTARISVDGRLESFAVVPRENRVTLFLELT